MSEVWRLFIAVELPEDVLKAIGRVQTDLKKVIAPRNVRWTRPEGIHLTLKFLGDVPASRAEEIGEALREVAARGQAFELQAQGLGCFPNVAKPRVLWLGLEGDLDRLRKLHTGVERRIAPMGFPTEERGFNPHLTLARTAQSATRDEAAAIGAVTSLHDPGQIAAWRVTSLSLIRSVLKPEGAIYTQIVEATLGAGQGSDG